MKKLLICLLVLSICAGIVACGEETPLESGDLVISFLSVGKADAILLKTASTSILIDTGYDTSAGIIADAMAREGIEKIDYMILTHYDKDHIGSASAIMTHYDIGQVYLPDFVTDSDEYHLMMDALHDCHISYQKISENVEIRLPEGATLTLNPTALSPDDENNHSIITSLRWGEFSCLFLGDALKDRLKEYENIDTSSYDVVKLPHHGNYYKKLEEYMTTVRPAHAVVCDGEEREVEEKLFAMCRDLGITLWQTDAGDIRLIYRHTEGVYRLTQE